MKITRVILMDFLRQRPAINRYTLCVAVGKEHTTMYKDMNSDTGIQKHEKDVRKAMKLFGFGAKEVETDKLSVDIEDVRTFLKKRKGIKESVLSREIGKGDTFLFEMQKKNKLSPQTALLMPRVLAKYGFVFSKKHSDLHESTVKADNNCYKQLFLPYANTMAEYKVLVQCVADYIGVTRETLQIQKSLSSKTKMKKYVFDKAVEYLCSGYAETKTGHFAYYYGQSYTELLKTKEGKEALNVLFEKYHGEITEKFKQIRDGQKS